MVSGTLFFTMHDDAAQYWYSVNPPPKQLNYRYNYFDSDHHLSSLQNVPITLNYVFAVYPVVSQSFVPHCYGHMFDHRRRLSWEKRGISPLKEI